MVIFFFLYCKATLVNNKRYFRALQSIMKKHLFFLFLFFTTKGFTQCEGCDNIGFENNDFSCWEADVSERLCDGCGTIWPFDRCCELKNFVNGFNPTKHLITTNGIDPVTGVLPTNSPFGGDYSMQLGDMAGGAIGQSIWKTFTVTDSNKLLSFEYALVLEDPGHDEEVQPYFKIDVFFNGDPTDKDQCASYEVIAGGNLPGFESIPGGSYKTWTKVFVDLRTRVGDDVTIKFTAADCELGGHYAYAYINMSCEPPTLEVKDTCDGTAIVAPQGVEFHWLNLDNGADTVTFDPVYAIPQTGHYQVEIFSENGCSITLDTFAQKLTGPFQGLLEHKKDLTCFEDASGSLTLNAQEYFGDLSFSIDSGLSYSNAPIFDGLSADSFYVVIKDQRDCADSFWVDLNEPDSLASTPQIVHNLCYENCQGEISINASGGTSPYNYQWSNAVFASSISALCAGDYTLTLTDDSGCVFTETYQITEPTELKLEGINDTVICQGGLAQLEAMVSGGLPPYAYFWDGASLGQTFDTAPLESTGHELVVLDSNNCSVSQNFTVEVLPPLEIDFVDSIGICPDSTLVLDPLYSGGDGNYQFLWSTGEMTSQIQVSPDMNTSYSVTLSDGCESMDLTHDLFIEVYELPQIDLTPDVTKGCAPLKVLFENNTDSSQVSLTEIDLSNGDVFSGVDDFLYNYTQAGVYPYSVTIFTKQGCKVEERNVGEIEVFQNPIADFTYQPQIEINMLNPEVFFFNQSFGETFYTWDFGGVDSSNQENPSVVFSQPGVHQISLLVETTHGCKDSMSLNINILPYTSLFVPNAFTPSDQNVVNNTFIFSGEGFDFSKPMSFQIIDRWGADIYSTNQYLAWDGRDKQNKMCPQGMYLYKIELFNVLGENVQKEGFVFLIR